MKVRSPASWVATMETACKRAPRAAAATTFGVLLVVLSCAHAPIDRNVRIGTPGTGSRVEDVPVKGYVAFVVADGGSYDGELLCVGKENLYLENDGGVVAIARESVFSVSIEIHDSGGTAVWVFTTAGALSATTHLKFAIFTVPLWLLTGLVVAGAESERNDVVLYEQNEIGDLYKYARYPYPIDLSQRAKTKR